MDLNIFKKIIKRIRVFFAARNAVADTKNRLSKGEIQKILVLCYGNIYRSPLVAQYLRDRLNDGFEIRSAGFHRKSDRSSPEEHIQMCAERHVDLSQHRSSIIDQSMVDWADAVVIMDKHNWYALTDFGRGATSKAIWLGALLRSDNCEIEDPYNKSQNDKIKILDQLFSASDELVGRVSR